MQAVILAAGLGSRLSAATGGRSKALVDIGGRALILHQLDALADHGVSPVLVVAGHQAEDLKTVVGDRAEVVVNDCFADTNSLYSLWIAREWITGPFVLLNCDLFFDPVILDHLLDESGNVLAYDSTSSLGREQTKVAIKQRRVVDIGKDLPPVSARGESLGLMKFDRDGAQAMLTTVDHLVHDGQTDAWVIEATRAVCSQVPLYGLNVAGRAWAEIDFPHDLDVARREVWPVIQRGRWRTHTPLKQMRWAAFLLAGAGLASAGWISNTRFGPGSVDWETIEIPNAREAALERDGALQRWWEVPVNVPVTAHFDGPTAVVEVRLMLPDGASGKQPYAVEMSVDEREDWHAFTATRDDSVHLAGTSLGNRHSILQSALSPGHHRVAVKLVDGPAQRMLVRIRRPEPRTD